MSHDLEALGLEPVIRRCARRLTARCPEYRDDLTQEARIIALRAIDQHDPSQGASLRTWVDLCIRSRLPWIASHTITTIRVSKKARAAGFRGEDSAVAEAARIVTEAKTLDPEFAAGEWSTPEDIAEMSEEREKLYGYILRQKADHASILTAYLAGDMLHEIGGQHGVSKQRVKQIVDWHTEKMKAELCA